MEREVINKYIALFGLGMVVLSLLEIIAFIILGFSTLEINGSPMTMNELFFTSGLFPLAGTIAWIFLLLITCGFLIFGMFLIFIVKKKNIELPYFAKYMLVAGIIILVGSFNMMEYIHVLQRTMVTITPNPVYLLTILSDLTYTPLSVVILWNYFIVVVCVYTVISLIIASGGLNITLKFERNALP